MKRQRERKGTPFPHFALNPDLSAMQLDEFLRQRQTKPGSLNLVRIVGAYLAKLFEDLRLVFRGDADAGITD